MTDSEKRYAHHDKEGLAIVFGVQKFYQYLYGHHFTIQTDNTTLSRIFHPDRAIPEITTGRLQRWAILLSTFRYSIKHIQGKENYADWLSRLPLAKTKMSTKKFPILHDIDETYLNNIRDSNFASLDWKMVQKTTREDLVLCQTMRYCLDGWPDTKPKDDRLRTMWEKREALSVENNCLLWGHRVIIPEKLRTLVLKELHHSHFGTARMKSLARSYVWWPKIDQQIEEITKECLPCLQNRKSQRKCLSHHGPGHPHHGTEYTRTS